MDRNNTGESRPGQRTGLSERASIVTLLVSGIGMIALAFILALFQRTESAATILAALGAGAVIIGVLLGRMEGPLEIGLGGIKAQLGQVQRNLDLTNRRLAALVSTMMYGPMYENLNKFRGGSFGHFKADEWFIEELKLMRMLGLVQGEWPGGLPKEGKDLSEHLRITPTGRKYIELCESLATTPADIDHAK